MMFLELVCMFTPVLGIVGAVRYAAQFTRLHLDDITEGDKNDVEK
jgi:hypothetical protein